MYNVTNEFIKKLYKFIKSRISWKDIKDKPETIPDENGRTTFTENTEDYTYSGSTNHTPTCEYSISHASDSVSSTGLTTSSNVTFADGLINLSKYSRSKGSSMSFQSYMTIDYYGSKIITGQGKGARVITDDLPLTLGATSGVDVKNAQSSSYVPIRASAFTTSSSKRFKENFSDVTEEEANNILIINPLHFDYINGSKNQVGFIAEDIEKIYPELCSYKTDENGEKQLFGLDYSKFIPYIIKFIQSQEKRIRKLESIISNEKNI